MIFVRFDKRKDAEKYFFYKRDKPKHIYPKSSESHQLVHGYFDNKHTFVMVSRVFYSNIGRDFKHHGRKEIPFYRIIFINASNLSFDESSFEIPKKWPINHVCTQGNITLGGHSLILKNPAEEEHYEGRKIVKVIEVPVVCHPEDALENPEYADAVDMYYIDAYVQEGIPLLDKKKPMGIIRQDIFRTYKEWPHSATPLTGTSENSIALADISDRGEYIITVDRDLTHKLSGYHILETKKGQTTLDISDVYYVHDKVQTYYYRATRG